MRSYRAVLNRRARWRAAVIRHRAPGMTGEVRALLLWVADHPYCDDGAVWSIPRSEIAEEFGVPEARINERIKRAKDLGLLCTVKRGVRGSTAVYEGTIPPAVESSGWRGSKANPKGTSGRTESLTEGTSDRTAIEGTSGRSQTVVDSEPVGRTHNDTPKGTSGRVATGSRDFPSPVDVPPLVLATPSAATNEVIDAEIVHDARSTQTLIAEYVDHCPQKPPSQVIGQLAKTIKRMLVDDQLDYDRVREGLAEWHRRGLHPSVLPSIVHELSTPRTRPRPNNHQQQTDDMFARAYARAQAGQNVFTPTTREIEAS